MCPCDVVQSPPVAVLHVAVNLVHTLDRNSRSCTAGDFRLAAESEEMKQSQGQPGTSIIGQRICSSRQESCTA